MGKSLGQCGLCQRRDLLSNLANACGCSKKSDQSGVHLACLSELLDQIDFLQHESQEIPICQSCRRPYRIKIQYRFRLACANFLKEGSILKLLELIVVVPMLVLILLFVNKIVFHKDMAHHKHSKDELESSPYIQLGFLIILILMLFIILAKIHFSWTHWKKSVSDKIVQMA